MTPPRKKLFTVLGTIQTIDGKKKFVPDSPKYLSDCYFQLPVGKKVACTFEEWKSIRSRDQLAYHWVLVGYIADYSGYTKEECHDALLRLKFGEKEIQFLGKTVKVRQSISDSAKMSVNDCVELITFDLQVAQEMGIVVPTPEELGYATTPTHR